MLSQICFSCEADPNVFLQMILLLVFQYKFIDYEYGTREFLMALVFLGRRI